ncbi:hypothetical protein PENSPDRAFT_687035 [Peniophora sp. CONT]|nr:hypothetical protein PENSPDRAFT_687035 [Peniophora sp. CONT]
MSENDGVLFPLLRLPVELIMEIAVWAQVIWRQETLIPHGPHSAVKRHAIAPPQTPNRERCCRHVDYSLLPSCWTASIPQTVRSPAHCMSQTCRRLRYVLLGPDSRVWRLDNALYKCIAERSGSQRHTAASPAGGAVVEYGTHTLVALQACACLLRGIEPFFGTLHELRVSMAAGGRDGTTSETEAFFISQHDKNLSPLQHFDLEIFTALRSQARPLIRAVRSPALLNSRVVNTSFFLYSEQLTSLYIHHPLSRKPRFGTGFWDALRACAAHLEYVTIDAGGGAFTAADPTALPNLRYLRLVAPARAFPWLLRPLLLPASVDIHLEPVVDWRTAASVQMAGRRPREVPFAAIEAAADAAQSPYALWRFMCALAAPEQTGVIFQHALPFHLREESLWQTQEAVGLDIRLDPSTTAFERACRRFPEIVSISFAQTPAELDAMFSDAGRDWQRSLSPVGKATTRRSLTVRDAMFKAADRERNFNPHLLTPVYDAMRHVGAIAVAGKPGGRFHVTSPIRTFTVHPDSWLPTFEYGWRSFLSPFNVIVELMIRCPYSDRDEPSPENREGHLCPAHLKALAAHLNDISPGVERPCPALRRVHIRSLTRKEGWGTLTNNWETAFNSDARLATGAHRIAVSVTD